MIGKLNRRIKFKKPAGIVRDVAGGTSNGPIELVLSTYAEVKPKNSAWLVTQGMEHLANSYDVTIRFRTSPVLGTTHIVEYEGRDLKIDSIKEDTEGKKRYLKLVCYEQQPGQPVT